jgi:hypothetical protein
MNTKLLMSASAIILGAVGLFLSFLPEEIIAYVGADSDKLLPVILQLLGAAYVGFAMLNWMAKGNLLGGIYSRPIAIGNLTHFLVAGLALLKVAYAQPDQVILLVLGLVFGLFAVLFGLVTFTHPAISIAKSVS